MALTLHVNGPSVIARVVSVPSVVSIERCVPVVPLRQHSIEVVECELELSVKATFEPQEYGRQLGKSMVASPLDKRSARRLYITMSLVHIHIMNAFRAPSTVDEAKGPLGISSTTDHNSRRFVCSAEAPFIDRGVARQVRSMDAGHSEAVTS